MSRKKSFGLHLFAALIIGSVVGMLPSQALAHHGAVSLGYGPGAPIATSSALTLPQGGFLVLAKVEQADWKKYRWARPENKDEFTFYNLGVGYGFKPYLTSTLFIPYVDKEQDKLGDSYGGGDVNAIFQFGFHYDPGKGIALNTPDDTAISLESVTKTFFSVYLGVSAPTGESHNKDEFEEEFERGMQPGFRSPAFVVGLSATRQLFHGFTLCADTDYTIFTKRDAFKFGNEFKGDIAAVYDLLTRPGVAGLQGILELNLLNVAKDEEGGEGIPNSGGTILYLSPGLRINFPPVSLGFLLKLPVWKDLNRQSEQQGAEGLEKYRAIVSLSAFF
jgi:hypothetical protein